MPASRTDVIVSPLCDVSGVRKALGYRMHPERTVQAAMKYLARFNRQLRHFRDSRKLSVHDISKLCLVDSTVVEAWEEANENRRCYPTLENLLDLCFKTGTALETFIEMPDSKNASQLELPGLTVTDESDLSKSLDSLAETIDRLIPSDQEQELLRRFRKSGKPNQELILKLIGR